MGNSCPVLIIVDVLSFSTCVEIACSRGGIVFPYPYKDGTATAFAAQHRAILAGHRNHAGPSLSPQSLMNLDQGTRLVLPSPNGATLSLLGKSTHIFSGCLRNAEAVATRAQREVFPIAVIGAAELWSGGSSRFAFEDLIGAGAIIHHLEGSKSPEASAAESAFLNVQPAIAPALRECVSGVELIDRGFPGDVNLAAQLNVSACVPELVNESFHWGEHSGRA